MNSTLDSIVVTIIAMFATVCVLLVIFTYFSMAKKSYDCRIINGVECVWIVVPKK